MSAEIQTIRLYRKLLEDDAEYCQENGLGDADGKCYYATDYFDVLFVSERKMEDAFSSIMNLRTDNSEVHATSVQSYTLYFSEEMYKKYEETGKYANRQSPFNVNNELAFLSIIQVHITPEVLRRMQYKDDTLCRKENSIILEAFTDDLYQIVDSFCIVHKEKRLVYRIYQVLSAGDFAVAVKSEYPEDSFYIAASIRKRVAGIAKEDKILPSKWAMYKTYTLLTMEGMLKRQVQTNNLERRNGYYVIRGCYSCRYWSNQSDFAGLMAQKNVSRPDDILGLNGRYDFSLQISEEEFYQIYPEIVRYKNGILIQERIGKECLPNKSGKVQYILFLLENGFLSYVNERYFLADINEQELPYDKDWNISSHVLIDNDRVSISSLKEENMAYIHVLKENYDRMRENYRGLEGVHQNFVQYLELLKKQILSCYTLNQQPDTRVYACGLGDLLERVLASVEVYRQLYEDAKENADKIEIMYLIVDYVRDSVHVLDSYAEYIRNNNLQSLQTPNYNIQSNMGMEKVLIGYSEYLWRFLLFYQNEMDDMKDAKDHKEFHPIVLPDLHKMDISVEVLFPEGNGDNWKREQNIRNMSEQNRRFLLMIDSPTLAELGDMPVFMAMLFHEVAHQLRYESRKERNKAIAKTIISAYMNVIADHMTKEFKKQSGEQDARQKLETMLSNVLADEAYRWFIDEHRLKEEELETPLFYFKRLFIGEIEELLSVWTNQMNVWDRARQFLYELKSAVDVFGKDEARYVDLFYHFIDSYVDIKEEKTKYADLFRIEKGAFAVTWRFAFDMLMEEHVKVMTQEEWLLDVEAVRKWCENEDDVLYVPLWESTFKKMDSKHQGQIDHIWKIFYDFAVWLEDYFENAKQQIENNVNKFFEQAYIVLCQEWEKENLRYVDRMKNPDSYSKEGVLGEYRLWSLAGRYLGLDKITKENKQRYRKCLAAFTGFSSGVADVEIDKYREITSDIFMYIIMDLSPFEYLNLVTLIIPGDELEKPFNLDRIVTVLYAMVDTDSADSEEFGHPYFLKMCGRIMSQLRYYYISLFQGETEDRILSEFDNIKENWGMDAETRKHVDLKLLEVCLEYAEEKAKDDIVRQKLQHLKKMVRLMNRVMFEGSKCIKTLEEDKNLLSDYKKGVRYLKRIRYKMEDRTDASMNELSELCSADVEYLKKYHYKTGIVENVELNKTGIEFLLGMYYGRKIRNTRRIRTRDED